MEGVSVHGSASVEDAYKLHRRFDRMGRLVGDAGMDRLQRSLVIVMGLGGVGSFAAESLVRSGVGRVRLVDFDDVCVTNTNRQLHALKGNIGKSKARLMAERLKLVNPQADVEAVHAFYQPETSQELLAGEPAYVVDAIDNMTAKCHLIATCVAREIPLVSSMGAAGRLDPTQIRVADLNHTHHCPMATSVRDILRRKHGFSREKGSVWGVAAVFSEEKYRAPESLAYEGDGGFRCVCPQGNNGLMTCDRRSRIDGSASFVTGAFGLVAASAVVRALTQPSPAAIERREQEGAL